MQEGLGERCGDEGTGRGGQDLVHGTGEGRKSGTEFEEEGGHGYLG